MRQLGLAKDIVEAIQLEYKFGTRGRMEDSEHC